MAETNPTKTRKKAPAKKPTAKKSAPKAGEATAQGEAQARIEDRIKTLRTDLERLQNHDGQFTHHVSELIAQKRRELATLEGSGN